MTVKRRARAPGPPIRLDGVALAAEHGSEALPMLRGPLDVVMRTPVLVLPGYADSDQDHWQSQWERADPACSRVVQRDWLEPTLEEWLATLERRVAACAAPPVLVAHSLGCALVAHWAARGGASAKGALLVAPADVDALARDLPEIASFRPLPLAPLPFPSIVVASTDDPLTPLDRATAFARAWSSRLVTLPGAGHVNAESGFGPWPEGRLLLAELTG